MQLIFATISDALKKCDFDTPEYGWYNGGQSYSHDYLYPTIEKIVDKFLLQNNIQKNVAKVFDAG